MFKTLPLVSSAQLRVIPSNVSHIEERDATTCVVYVGVTAYVVALTASDAAESLSVA